MSGLSRGVGAPRERAEGRRNAADLDVEVARRPRPDAQVERVGPDAGRRSRSAPRRAARSAAPAFTARREVEAQHPQRGMLVVGVVEEPGVVGADRRRDVAAERDAAVAERQSARTAASARRRVAARQTSSIDEQARPSPRRSLQARMIVRGVNASSPPVTHDAAAVCTAPGSRGHRIQRMTIVPGIRRVSDASGYGESSVTDSNRPPDAVQPRATRDAPAAVQPGERGPVVRPGGAEGVERLRAPRPRSSLAGRDVLERSGVGAHLVTAEQRPAAA